MSKCPFHTADYSDFDHHSAHHREDAEAVWNEMREQPTLPHSDKYGGFFVVTRLADLRKVTAKPALFSSAKGVALPSEDRSPHIPEEVDPPLHGEYRRLLEPFLTQDEVAKLEPMVRRHVLDLLDSFAGETRIDFVRRFSEPLPVRFSLEPSAFRVKTRRCFSISSAGSSASAARKVAGSRRRD